MSDWDFASLRKMERRRAPRIEGTARVEVVTARRIVSAELVDVSLSGFKIRLLEEVGLPPKARLRLPDHGIEVDVRMVWARQPFFGWLIVYSRSALERMQVMMADIARKTGRSKPLRIRVRRVADGM